MLEVEVLWWKLFHDPRGMRTASRKLRDYDVKKKGEHFSARMLGREIDLTMYHLVNSINELEMWEREYLPTNLKGKTVLDAGAGCLPKGEVLLGGNKDVSAYEVGEKVLGSRGLADVLETFERDYAGLMYEIRALCCLPFRVTAEHPVLAVNGEFKYGHRKSGRVLGEASWKTPNQLQVPRFRTSGDYLVFPKLREKEGLCPVEFELEYLRSSPKRYGRVTIDLSPDVAELLGLYVGGGTSDHRVQIWLRSTALDIVERCVSLVRKSLSYRVKLRNRGSVIGVVFGSAPLARFLHANFGDDATTKRIPDWMLFAPKEILARFLYGLWEADGHLAEPIRRGHREFKLGFTSASRILALQIQLCLSKFDIMASITRKRRDEVTSHMSHRGDVAVSGEAFQVDVVGYNKNVDAIFRVNSKSESGRITKRYLEDENNFYLPVTDISSSDFEGNVYNLRTTTGDYLISNCVVHNCGETALFFLNHGARRVVAIEKDERAHSLLRSNSQDLPIDVLPCMAFSLDHLQVPHDFLKMDIEGGETLLLKLPRMTDLGPCVIEAHRFNDQALPEKLQTHLGLTKYHEIGKNAVLLTNVSGDSPTHEQ